MPRTRWTRTRLTRMAFLAGRGRTPREIANDPLIGSTMVSVIDTARVHGIAFPDRPACNVPVDLPGVVFAKLEEQARRRRMEACELLTLAAKILADDSVLMDNVLDDAV